MEIFHVFDPSGFEPNERNRRLFRKSHLKVNHRPFQTSTGELKAVLFKRDEIEHLDKSVLIAFLSLIANQQNFLRCREYYSWFLETNCPIFLKTDYGQTPQWKNEAGRWEEKYEFDHQSTSRLHRISLEKSKTKKSFRLDSWKVKKNQYEFQNRDQSISKTNLAVLVYHVFNAKIGSFFKTIFLEKWSVLDLDVCERSSVWK